MSTKIRARLRGPDMLVCPGDKRNGLAWMATYAEGEVPYDSEIGRQIVGAHERGDPVVYRDQTYWVERLEIDIGPE